MGMLSDSAAVPALPGAQKMRSASGDWAKEWTRACSLPPPPTTSTRMRPPSGVRAGAGRRWRRPGPTPASLLGPGTPGKGRGRRSPRLEVGLPEGSGHSMRASRRCRPAERTTEGPTTGTIPATLRRGLCFAAAALFATRVRMPSSRRRSTPGPTPVWRSAIRDAEQSALFKIALDGERHAPRRYAYYTDGDLWHFAGPRAGRPAMRPASSGPAISSPAADGGATPRGAARRPSATSASRGRRPTSAASTSRPTCEASASRATGLCAARRLRRRRSWLSGTIPSWAPCSLAPGRSST